VKVLVVEDEDLVRELAVARLEEAGFEVVEAASGEGALERADGGADAVVVDIGLPGELDGWDVAERLRANSPELPVVYASGGEATDRRDVPGSRYLRKPCTAEAVIVAICEQVASTPQSSDRREDDP
jgi:CheY-like chemotaxis protein